MAKKLDNVFGGMGRKCIDKVRQSLGVNTISGTDGQHLPISLYQDWFDILVKGDTQSAEILLQTASSEERSLLLDCPFDFEDLHGFGLYFSFKCLFLKVRSQWILMFY